MLPVGHVRVAIGDKDLENRFGERWSGYGMVKARDNVRTSTTRRWISEMDIVVGLYRMRLAERDDIEKVARE